MGEERVVDFIFVIGYPALKLCSYALRRTGRFFVLHCPCAFDQIVDPVLSVRVFDTSVGLAVADFRCDTIARESNLGLELSQGVGC